MELLSDNRSSREAAVSELSISAVGRRTARVEVGQVQPSCFLYSDLRTGGCPLRYQQLDCYDPIYGLKLSRHVSHRLIPLMVCLSLWPRGLQDHRVAGHISCNVPIFIRRR